MTRPLAFARGRFADAAADAFRVDLRDHLVFPGLVNAHDHLQLNSVPPLAHAEPFPNSYAWIGAFESHLRDHDVVAATRVPSDARHWLGGLKNLFSGVTTVAHHDPWNGVLDDPDFPVGVLRKFGWSHSLGLGESRETLPRYGPPVRESFSATPAGHPWIIHLAEGTDEVAAAELSRLDALGCLASNTVLVHGVGLTSADVERVIERNAAVVWCPASGLGMLGRTLAAGVVRRLHDAGRLALGTDSRLTGSRDLLGELGLAAAHSDLSSRELLRLVTVGSSRVLRQYDRGRLDIGQPADCLIVRAGADPFDTLIHTTRRDIRAVVRGGAPVLADPDFADWFAQCGVEVAPVRLDGQPKLLARGLMRPEMTALEPGFECIARPSHEEKPSAR